MCRARGQPWGVGMSLGGTPDQPPIPDIPPRLQFWREFPPRAAISYLEFDAACAEPFRPAIEATGGWLHVGSQDDTAFLQSIVDLGQSYDVILDDGRHLPTDQSTSLRGLWPALKSGGVYIIEVGFHSRGPAQGS